MTADQPEGAAPTRKNARIAGFLYVLLGITAPIGLMYW
jgi:hypothetical protein